jgi:hypothetical protein
VASGGAPAARLQAVMANSSSTADRAGAVRRPRRRVTRRRPSATPRGWAR